MRKRTIASFGLLLFAAAPALAGSSAKFQNSELQVKNSNGIPYISGGFGLEEREQLRGMSNGDNLQLSFALEDGSYLGGANVLIKDAQGKTILETASEGPLFFAKLPPGKYTIDATAMGKTIEQVTQVPAKGQKHVYFAWNGSQNQASRTF
jgi:hypothetical protein